MVGEIAKTSSVAPLGQSPLLVITRPAATSMALVGSPPHLALIKLESVGTIMSAMAVDPARTSNDCPCVSS